MFFTDTKLANVIVEKHPENKGIGQPKVFRELPPCHDVAWQKNGCIIRKFAYRGREKLYSNNLGSVELLSFPGLKF